MGKSTLTSGDYAIIEAAQKANNPNIFLEYYVRPKNGGYFVYPGSIRWEQYEQHWNANGRPEKFVTEWGGVVFEVERQKHSHTGTVVYFEYRGFLLLPWQLAFWQADQKDKIVIGTPGVGKTYGVAAMAMYACATNEYYKFANLAPTQKQAGLMIEALREGFTGTALVEKFVKHSRQDWYVQKPFMHINFNNGSTFEVFNLEHKATNIQGIWFDWGNIDEAGLLNKPDESGKEQLAAMMTGIVTRSRATRPNGVPRSEIVSMISMAYDCDTMWDRFEAGLKPNSHTYSKRILFDQNPYLTPANIKRWREEAKAAGTEEQWMEGKRPPPRGAEISGQLVRNMIKPGLIEIARTNYEQGVKGYEYHEGPGGVLWYQEPYQKDHDYILVGDPGTGGPPDRNAPNLQVWDATNFPHTNARLSAFWWGHGDGKYQPFISKFEELVYTFKVVENFRGYDSTASQKSLAEFAFEQGSMKVMPMGFEGIKKWQYLNALKLLLGEGLLDAPDIDGLKTQLTRYRLPDNKIPQDIVATCSMAAYMLMALYRMVYPEDGTDDKNAVGDNPTPSGRDYRSHYSRSNRSR